MLTESRLRAAIYCRLKDAYTANHTRRIRVFGQIEGMVFTLTGQHFPVTVDTKVADILTVCSIPYVQKEDGVLETPDEWMQLHGFDPDGPNSYGDHHSTYSHCWRAP